MFRDLFIVAIVMLLLDAVWLYGQNSYHRQLFQSIQGTPMRMRAVPAAIVYALMATGLWWFVIRRREHWTTAALLGLLVYGVYDFTNYATLTNYTLYMTLSDTLWGATLFGLTTAIVYYLTQ